MTSPLGLLKTSRLFRIGLVFAFLVLGCAADSDYPENIILFIGDGMGVGQMTAGRLARGGPLAWDRAAVCGLVTTLASDTIVTDSAAAATAMACGRKTKNGMVGVDPDGNPLKTVLEYAEEQGRATGLVATSSITHATPACFAAHVPDRDQEKEIAAQLAESGVDVLLGGGAKFFLPSDTPPGEADRDLVEAMRARGYAILRSEEDLAALDPAVLRYRESYLKFTQVLMVEQVRRAELELRRREVERPSALDEIAAAEAEALPEPEEEARGSE